MMKSKYIFKTELDEKLFLMNLLTFTYVFLEKDEKTLWNEGRFDEMTTFDKLRKEYFIVDDDSKLIDYAVKTLSKKGHMNPHHVIYITDECNQRCTYCFESRIDVLGTRKKVLSHEQIDKIFDTIENLNSPKKKQSTITLFGGEPLLAKNKSVISYLLDTVKNRLIQKVDIVTNGLTLDNYTDLINYYKSEIGTLILTLNGYKEKHDFVRGSLNQPTFDKMIENIHYFLSKTQGVNIRINILLDKTNVAEMRPLLSFLRDEGISTNERVDLAFGRIQFRVDPDNKQYNKELSYEDYYSSLYNHYYNEELVQDEMICGSEVSILAKIYNFWRNNGLVYPELKGCAAVYPGRFCYFVDDNIYPCTEIAGLEEFSIGNYMKSGVDDEKFESWYNYKVPELSKCRGCKYIGLCNGACPVSNITATKKMNDVYCLKMEESLQKFVDTLYMKGFFYGKS